MAIEITTSYSIHDIVFVVDERDASIKQCKVIRFEARVEAEGSFAKRSSKFMLKSEDDSYYFREEKGMFKTKEQLMESLDPKEVF